MTTPKGFGDRLMRIGAKVFRNGLQATKTEPLTMAPVGDKFETDGEVGNEQRRLASDPKFRKCVEAYSMQCATNYFARNYSVEDVHATESYDLRCTGLGKTLKVEVKGTTTRGDKVIMTGNEVRLAVNAETVLFLVHSIIVREAVSGYEARGGVCLLYMPLELSGNRVQAISCAVDLRGMSCIQISDEDVY